MSIHYDQRRETPFTNALAVRQHGGENLDADGPRLMILRASQRREEQQHHNSHSCYHPRSSDMGRMISRLLVLFVATLLSGQVQPLAMNSNAAAAYESLLRLKTTVTALHTT